VISLCATVGFAQPANDDELHGLVGLSFEELLQIKVTTVSRVEERQTDTPGSVHVFTREMIQRRGYRSLAELLQVVPGFTVFHRDLQYVAGVRGLNANDNAKISLMINGQVLNNIHEPDFLNGPINLDNVERVEVSVGPSSLFQPANTLAATVNVITRDVSGGELMLATGNDLPYSGTLMIGEKWAEDKYLNFSFSLERKDGFDAWTTRANLAGRELTGELEAPSYFGILKGRHENWSGQAVAYRSTWPELNILSGSMDNDGRYTDEMYSAFVENDRPLSDSLTSILRADISYKKTTRENMNGQAENAVEQFLEQVVYTAELGLRYSGFERQVIQVGVQGSYDENLDNYYTWYSGGTGPSPLFNNDTYAVGFYVDDLATVTDWLKLVGGIRVDHNERLEGDRWFPGGRAAVIVEPMGNWVSKLIFNRAVRIPTALEAMNMGWGASVPTSPDWATNNDAAEEPEILETFEFQNIVYWGHVRVGATLYHQELDDFTTWFGPHGNGGDFDGNGLELDIQAPLDERVTIWANATVNDSTLSLFDPDLFGPGSGDNEAHHSYVNQSGRTVGSAGYVVNGGCELRMTDHLVFAPTVRYFTDQVGVDAETSRYVKLNDNVYVDAVLRWERLKTLGDTEMDLTLSGRNILDNRDPIGSPMNGHLYAPRGAEVVLAASIRL